VQALREGIRELGRRGDLHAPHLAVPDDLVREVLPDVDMLGSLRSANDVVSPLDARRVLLKHLRGDLVSEAEPLEGVSEIQGVHACPADAEQYSATAVERAVVLCILERRMVGVLLCNITFPDEWTGGTSCFPSQSRHIP
jgi:hypothetical protein